MTAHRNVFTCLSPSLNSARFRVARDTGTVCTQRAAFTCPVSEFQQPVGWEAGWLGGKWMDTLIAGWLVIRWMEGSSDTWTISGCGWQLGVWTEGRVFK